jgi:uncharacterized membrane protein (DUF106 family)
MEKEGILLGLKLQNGEIPIAVLAGLIAIGVIILILSSMIAGSESKSNQQEFIDKLRKKEEKLREKEERLHQIQEQLEEMH